LISCFHEQESSEVDLWQVSRHFISKNISSKTLNNPSFEIYFNIECLAVWARTLYLILVLYSRRLLLTTEILLKAMARAARMG
jgi:hypothetical protein